MAKLTTEQYLEEQKKILKNARDAEERIKSSLKKLNTHKLQIERELGYENSKWWHLKISTMERLEILEKKYITNDLNSEEND